MPVADAPFRDLLAQPHDEGRPRGQGQDRHEAEVPARLQHDGLAVGTPRAFEAEADHHALDDRKHDGAVARVLRDLLAADVAFLGQPFQVGEDHRQELQDDRRADIGHDAQREDRELLQRAPGEQVEQAEDRPLDLGEERRQPLAVNARSGYGHADAIDRQHRQGEQDPSPQLRGCGPRFENPQAWERTSTRPPAASIFSLALRENPCAFTVSGLSSSPRPRIFTNPRPSNPFSRNRSGETS